MSSFQVCLPCGGVGKGNFEPTPVTHFGEDAALGDAPWQVALSEQTGSDILDENFCGGTLINGDWILTAAQCTRGWVRIECSRNLTYDGVIFTLVGLSFCFTSSNFRRDPTQIYAYIGLVDLQDPGPRAQCDRFG